MNTARASRQLYLDAARQEYARAWTLFDLNSKELFVLARHMCCKLADALQPQGRGKRRAPRVHPRAGAQPPRRRRAAPSGRARPALSQHRHYWHARQRQDLHRRSARRHLCLQRHPAAERRARVVQAVGRRPHRRVCGADDARVEERVPAPSAPSSSTRPTSWGRRIAAIAPTRSQSSCSTSAKTRAPLFSSPPSTPTTWTSTFFGPNPATARSLRERRAARRPAARKTRRGRARSPVMLLGPRRHRGVPLGLHLRGQEAKRRQRLGVATRRGGDPDGTGRFETQADSMQKLALECRNRMLDEPRLQPPTAEGARTTASWARKARCRRERRSRTERRVLGRTAAPAAPATVPWTWTRPADPSTEAGPSATNREELRKRMEEWEKEQLHRGTGKTAEKYKANYACSAYQANNYGVEELRECMTLILTRRRKAEGTAPQTSTGAFDEETPPPNYAQPWTDASPRKVPFKDLDSRSTRRRSRSRRRTSWLAAGAGGDAVHHAAGRPLERQGTGRARGV